MAQFYCLSVLLSILCGLILIYGQDEGFGGDGLDEGEFDAASKKSVPGLEKIQEGIAGEALFEKTGSTRKRRPFS